MNENNAAGRGGGHGQQKNLSRIESHGSFLPQFFFNINIFLK